MRNECKNPASIYKIVSFDLRKKRNIEIIAMVALILYHGGLLNSKFVCVSTINVSSERRKEDTSS